MSPTCAKALNQLVDLMFVNFNNIERITGWVIEGAKEETKLIAIINEKNRKYFRQGYI